MKVKISRFLLGLMLLYVILWFGISALIQNKLPEKLKNLEEMGVKFSFEEISVKGFPFSFEISFLKPNFELLNAEIFKSKLNQKIAVEQNQEKLQILRNLLNDRDFFNFKYSSEKSLIFNLNLLFTLSKIKLQGGSTYELKILQDRFKVASKGKAGMLEITLDAPILKQNDDFLTQIKGINLNCKECEFINLNASGKKILSSEQFYNNLQIKKINNGFGSIDLDFTIKNLNLTKHGVEVLQKLQANSAYKAIFSDQPMTNASLKAFEHFNGSGSINYEGTVNKKDFEQGDVKFSLKCPFELVSSNFSSDSSLDVDFSMKKGDVKFVKIDWKGENSFTVNFYKIILSEVQKLAGTLRKEKSKWMLPETIDHHSETYINNLQILVPHFHRFGKLKSEIKLTYLDKNDTENLSIKKLEFEFLGRKIKFTGEGARRNGATSYDLKIKMSKYQEVADSILAYVRRVADEIRKIDFNAAPEQNGILYYDKLDDFVKASLSEFAEESILSKDEQEIEFELVKNEKNSLPIIKGKEAAFERIVQNFLIMVGKHTFEKKIHKETEKVKEKVTKKLNKIIGDKLKIDLDSLLGM